MISLTGNQTKYSVDVSPDVLLLWVIREYLRVTVTKFGCGVWMFGLCQGLPMTSESVRGAMKV
jgi:isoquinoline 1-oxidoreductase alpha subunit